MNVFEVLKTYAELGPYLLPIVMALVTLYGKFGVTGKWQLVSSLVTGIVLGGVFMYAEASPQTLVDWLSVGTFGLVLGLTASGVYNVGKSLTKKS